MGEKIPRGMITKTVEATSYKVIAMESCPRCGWEVPADRELIVVACEACGETMITFGTGEKRMMEVMLG